MGHFLLVCPVFPQDPHFLAFFGGGGESGDGEFCLLTGLGYRGTGQVTSCVGIGQSSRIFSNKYHCRGTKIPFVGMMLGNSAASTTTSCFRIKWVSSSESLHAWVVTIPGWSDDTLKCRKFLMAGGLLNISAKKLIQSRIGTSTFPPLSNTSWAWFTKDFSTILKKRKVCMISNNCIYLSIAFFKSNEGFRSTCV